MVLSEEVAKSRMFHGEHKLLEEILYIIFKALPCHVLYEK